MERSSRTAEQTFRALGVWGACVFGVHALAQPAAPAALTPAAPASLADTLPIIAFVSALIITILTIFGGSTVRTRLPVIASFSGVLITGLLGLMLWTPSLVTPAFQAVIMLMLCALASEISLALSATPYPGGFRTAFRSTQLLALTLGLLLLFLRDNADLARIGLWFCTAAFGLMGLNATYLGVVRQRFALYVGFAWFAMSVASVNLGFDPYAVAPVGQTATPSAGQGLAFYTASSAAFVLLASSTLLMALGLMHKTMRSHAAWARELEASKETDRMLRLEQSQRQFSQEVDAFLDSVLPNDFEEVVLNSFLSHLDRVISVSASAVVVSHRGQMRLVSRFPQGNNTLFASVLATRENLLQSVCLSDKAAILHSDDYGLAVGDEPLSTLCVVPVEAPRNEWAGVVLARTSKTEFQFGELLLVKRFAEHVRMAFENANKFNKIRRQAETDTLTGLMNRRAITGRAERAFKKARSLQHDLSFLFIDIDNFKLVNDTYGHEAGDRALFNVAQICQSSLRDNDQVGRYGGEEFIAILPGTGEHHAQIVAERIRQSVSDSSLNLEDGAIQLTVSVGISEITRRFKNSQDMLNAADRALYVAKRDGRNRVVHDLRIVSSSSDDKAG